MQDPSFETKAISEFWIMEFSIVKLEFSPHVIALSFTSLKIVFTILRLLSLPSIASFPISLNSQFVTFPLEKSTSKASES